MRGGGRKICSPRHPFGRIRDFFGSYDSRAKIQIEMRHYAAILKIYIYRKDYLF